MGTNSWALSPLSVGLHRCRAKANNRTLCRFRALLPNVRVRKNIRNSAARGELPEVRAFGSINFNYTTYYQRDACCPLKDIPTVAPVPAVILQHAPFCVALGNRFCLRGKARFFFFRQTCPRAQNSRLCYRQVEARRPFGRNPDENTVRASRDVSLHVQPVCVSYRQQQGREVDRLSSCDGWLLGMYRDSHR